MGLAAFGEVLPDLADTLEAMLLVENGRLQFAAQETVEAAQQAAARHSRRSSDPIMQAADLAATGQEVYARLADRILQSVTGETPRNLIVTGGCALNSSYNGTLVGRREFGQVFVPSAPADDGNAVGAAVLAWMKDTGATALPTNDGSPYLGSAPNARAVAKAARSAGACEVTDLSGRSAE